MTEQAPAGKTAMSLIDWLLERRDNAFAIASTTPLADRDGWLEDADYFQRAITALAAAVPAAEPVRLLTDAEAMDAYAQPGQMQDSPPWMDRINSVLRAFMGINAGRTIPRAEVMPCHVCGSTDEKAMPKCKRQDCPWRCDDLPTTAAPETDDEREAKRLVRTHAFRMTGKAPDGIKREVRVIRWDNGKTGVEITTYWPDKPQPVVTRSAYTPAGLEIMAKAIDEALRNMEAWKLPEHEVIEDHRNNG